MIIIDDLQHDRYHESIKILQIEEAHAWIPRNFMKRIKNIMLQINQHIKMDQAAQKCDEK